MRISGNTILITGGSRGIGLEMARHFSGAGNKVIVMGRNQAGLSKAAAEISNFSTIQSDAADPAQIKSLADQMGAEFPDTNVIINTAGIMWS